MYAASVARNRLFTAAFNKYQIRRLSHTMRWSSTQAVGNRYEAHAGENTRDRTKTSRNSRLDPGTFNSLWRSAYTRS